MKLADRVALYREPFRVADPATGQVSTLNSAVDCARAIEQCAVRFVLSDELTRRCAVLAYSKGARTLGCADLLCIPAEWVWVEWSYFVWQRELDRYGLRAESASCTHAGRRGALISASPDRRRGTVRTFWTNDNDTGVLASSVEGWFDLDKAQDEPPDGDIAAYLHCFRFRYERSWQKYYYHAAITPAARDALARHARGMIAADIPLVLAFFLLLATVYSQRIGDGGLSPGRAAGAQRTSC